MDCFITAKANAFENLLEPLQKLLRLSPPIALSLAQPDFFRRILQKLKSNKALTRLSLLRIVQSICDASDEQCALINVYGLYDTIQQLAESDSAILVRDMANKLTKSCDEHELLGRSGGKRRATRRTSASTTPPGMSSSSHSMPPTPTSSRSTHSTSYFVDGDRPRSIISGPTSFRATREDSLGGSVLSNGVNGAAIKSRLPRTTSSRNQQHSLLYSAPRREETASPSPSTKTTPSLQPVMMSNSRRRRQTSGGESRWT